MSKHNKAAFDQRAENELFTKVTVRGTVRRKSRMPKSLAFVVATYNTRAGKCDFPRFVAFENLSEFDKTFTLGDRVTVTGYIHTNKKYPEGILIPTSIVVEKSRLDAAFAKETYKPDMNEVVLRGRLASEPFAPTATTTLTTFEAKNSDNSRSFVRAVSFGRVATALKEHHKSDVVEAMGYVRTKPMTEVKERSHTQSLVITAIR